MRYKSPRNSKNFFSSILNYGKLCRPIARHSMVAIDFGPVAAPMLIKSFRMIYRKPGLRPKTAEITG